MFLSEIAVSLLVRLWVEMPWPLIPVRPYPSASLWGCELKCVPVLSTVPSTMSASLWGCELKCPYPKTAGILRYRQPPCEAVSWNIIRSEYTWDDCTSASLWGCELKYRTVKGGEQIDRQPPCEAVSWNASSNSDCIICCVSLLVRLWVEIANCY